MRDPGTLDLTVEEVDSDKEKSEKPLDPTIPLVEKQPGTFMPTIKKIGAALVLVIVAIALALGLVKFLIFLFGVFFLLAIQISMVVHYIVKYNQQ